jgi:uncharacterized protein affecting Mg2+/Co2+ transport
MSSARFFGNGEVLATVCRFLEPEDITNLSFASKDLFSICSTLPCWSRHLARLLPGLPPPSCAPRGLPAFAHLWRGLGPSARLYAPLHAAFSDVLALVAECRGVTASLQPPRAVRHGDLSAEVRALHPSVAALYLVTGGQEVEGMRAYDSLFGHCEAYGEMYAWPLRPELDVGEGGAVVGYGENEWVVGEAGEVRSCAGRVVIAESLVGLFRDHAERIRSGELEIVDVQGLRGGIDPAARAIWRIPRAAPHQSTCVSPEGVEISSSSLLLGAVNRDRRRGGGGGGGGGGNNISLIFTYEITLSMAAHPAREPCRLTRRHWEIKDNTNPAADPEIVEGVGVIGLRPEVFAGMAPFRYRSICEMNTILGGTMDGWFEFAKPDGTLFRATVPTIQLDPKIFY